MLTLCFVGNSDFPLHAKKPMLPSCSLRSSLEVLWPYGSWFCWFLFNVFSSSRYLGMRSFCLIVMKVTSVFPKGRLWEGLGGTQLWKCVFPPKDCKFLHLCVQKIPMRLILTTSSQFPVQQLWLSLVQLHTSQTSFNKAVPRLILSYVKKCNIVLDNPGWGVGGAVGCFSENIRHKLGY